jgi:O-antigen ligase
MGADRAYHPRTDSIHQQVVLGGILVSLAANLLYPGEVFFQSKFLFVIVSTLAFPTALALQQRSGNLGQIIRRIGIIFAPLLFFLPSTLTTINSSRSQDVFLIFFAYACLFATLQLIRVEFSNLIVCLLFLAIVAFCIDLFSLYQYFFGLSELKALVLNSTALDEKLKSGVLTRITTRRVFGNFPLPNTLAGFVTMVLPLNVFLLYTALGLGSTLVRKSGGFVNNLFPNPLTSCFLCIQLCLSLLVLALTQSFGGWVCFCFAVGLLALWAIFRLRISVKLRTTALLTALVLVTAGLVWVSYQRGFSLWNLQASENPIALRLNNYKTALQIFRDFPITGVGLGNYGSINSRYQSSPATVSQYAHNTILQLLCEMGASFLAILLLVSIATTKLWRTLLAAILPDSTAMGFLKVCLEASLVAWLVHNLLDIDFYFPSLGSLGVFLLGIFASHCQTKQEQRSSFRTSNKRRLLPVMIFWGAMSLAVLLAVRNYIAESLCSLAVDYGEGKNFEQALHFMDQALAVQGNDAAKIVLQAKLACLDADQKRQAGLTQLLALRQAYERAIQLDAFNASYHHELSRVLFALGETKLSLRSRDRAIELFPSEPKFKRSPTAP